LPSRIITPTANIMARGDIPMRLLWHKVWSGRLNTCIIYTKLPHSDRLNWIGNQIGSLCILSIKTDSIHIETMLHLNRGSYVYNIHVIKVLRKGFLLLRRFWRHPIWPYPI
jgi:hypothetical protein